MISGHSRPPEDHRLLERFGSQGVRCRATAVQKDARAGRQREDQTQQETGRRIDRTHRQGGGHRNGRTHIQEIAKERGGRQIARRRRAGQTSANDETDDRSVDRRQTTDDGEEERFDEKAAQHDGRDIGLHAKPDGDDVDSRAENEAEQRAQRTLI
ncbi:unnamed protein product, partial [Nesidiocoris tenuis]